MTMSYQYPGGELEVFAHASNWKAYWSSQVRPWLRGRVIEVGGGMGANIAHLLQPDIVEFLSIEPDEKLFGILKHRVAAVTCIPSVRALQGTLLNIPVEAAWDGIVYIDVLEHIEDDRGELFQAAQRLRSGGVIVVLSPAHQWLYSKFDASIGHFRRYNQAMMSPLTPPDCRLDGFKYLDMAGLLASSGNRFLLRQSCPGLRQIRFWDRLLVPLSRRLDPLFGHRIGKTVLAIWRKA